MGAMRVKMGYETNVVDLVRGYRSGGGDCRNVYLGGCWWMNRKKGRCQIVVVVVAEWVMRWIWLVLWRDLDNQLSYSRAWRMFEMTTFPFEVDWRIMRPSGARV
jgi:hypothetical protein